MTLLVILGVITTGGALAAILMRNLVHCALGLTLTFAGLAALYLQLGAQFVGFAQVLVYIGAVAILIVFAILLTQGSKVISPRNFSSTWWWSVGVAVAVFAVIARVILSSPALKRESLPAPEPTVKDIGVLLMTKYLLPLEVLGVLLTAALIGAVLLALQERRPPEAPGADAAPPGFKSFP